MLRRLVYLYAAISLCLSVCLSGLTVVSAETPVSPPEQPALSEIESDETPLSPELKGSAVYQAPYLINAGDTIDLEDANMGVLVKEGTVLADGSLRLPLVGKISIAGLSVAEAKQLLNQRYQKYYVNPQITLRLLTWQPTRFYVMGAVASPGVYTSGKNLDPENKQNAQLGSHSIHENFYQIYVADALLIAGGLNYNANVQDIKIHRKLPEPITIHVNLIDLLKNGNLIHDFPLRDQDVIEVSEVPANAVVMNDDWEAFAKTNTARQDFKVSVLGAVEKPDAYSVTREDNVLTAITKAGGFSKIASHDKVFILRTTNTGQVIKRELNMKDRALIGKKPFETWAALLPNDVVFVDDSRGKRATRFGLGVADRAANAAMFPFFNNLFSDR